MADELEFLATIDGFRITSVKVAKDMYEDVYKMVVSVPVRQIKDANRLINFARQGCYVTLSESQTGLKLGD
jgi:hypothetical protein